MIDSLAFAEFVLDLFECLVTSKLVIKNNSKTLDRLGHGSLLQVKKTLLEDIPEEMILGRFWKRFC